MVTKLEPYLTYADIAKSAGMPEGTLRRKLILFNKEAGEEDQIAVDKVEDHDNFEKHLFTSSTMVKIIELMKTFKVKRGRPRK